VSALNGRPVTWHRALSEVSSLSLSLSLTHSLTHSLSSHSLSLPPPTKVPSHAPLVLLAHELFDALPVQQLTRTPLGWCERVVDVADQDRCEAARGGGGEGAERRLAAPRPAP
jgi:hypothetical protein